ncbi:MAG: hypothetical protein HY056_13745 [Proteobacteria bacterium]|nr:hypothetical protein [Pseudomonadota bacterium]
MAALAGPLLVLVFTLSQSLRDVYFAGVFQRVDHFVVILLAFLLSTAMFATVALIRRRAGLRALRGHAATILAVNAATALAWSCYFLALTRLDPSVVNTIHSGMGPLTIVAMGYFGISLAQAPQACRVERTFYAAIALSLAALWWVVLSGHAGLREARGVDLLAGLALASISGASITVSLLFCKRLQDRGVGADAVTAVRYIALILFAGAAVTWNRSFGDIATPAQFATLSFAVIALIVLPLYWFQVGIGRTSPLTANIIRALGPVFVFALEQFDARMRYSTPVLVCILIYSVAVVASNIARGWRDEPRAQHRASPAQ